MLLMEKNGSSRIMPTRAIDGVREVWRKQGRPPVPSGICEQIEKHGFPLKVKSDG
jgi:hypothetical protein